MVKLADPPASDSPKNILNALNDDCIGEVFRRLEMFEDFLNAAQTCRRFQKCAADAQDRFKWIAIADRSLVHLLKEPVKYIYTKQERFVPPFCAPMLLQNFGHLIKSIDLIANRQYPNHNKEIYELIVRYCGETLNGLHITGFCKRGPIRVLNNLISSSLKFVSLVLLKNQKPWFLRHFPHLQNVSFNSDNQLTNDLLTEFLSLNPQLQRLTVNDCDHISPKILRSIGTYAKNLHTLNTYWSKRCEIDDNEILELKALQKLKSFHMGQTIFSSEVLLMNMFAENNIQINSLYIDAWTQEIVKENLPTLETLKELYIYPFRFDDGISDDFLINWVKCQPNLEYISIYGNVTVTMQAIIRMLELGKNLTGIDFWSDFGIDLRTYNEILNLAKNRVKVVMKLNEIDVPKNVLDANKKWLDIARHND